jgi:hypothetical protein
MMDHLANITTKAHAAHAGMVAYQKLRAELRQAIVQGDRANGVNEIIRAAGPGMSKQKVIETLDAGRLQREVLRALDEAGLRPGLIKDEDHTDPGVFLGAGRYVHVIHLEGEREATRITRALESAGYQVEELEETVLRVSRAGQPVRP